MTIKVKVENDKDSPDIGMLCYVGVVDKDIHGNKANDHNQLTKLAPGESKEFYIHDMRELRVYETSVELNV